MGFLFLEPTKRKKPQAVWPAAFALSLILRIQQTTDTPRLKYNEKSVSAQLFTDCDLIA